MLGRRSPSVGSRACAAAPPPTQSCPYSPLRQTRRDQTCVVAAVGPLLRGKGGGGRHSGRGTEVRRAGRAGSNVIRRAKQNKTRRLRATRVAQPRPQPKRLKHAATCRFPLSPLHPPQMPRPAYLSFIARAPTTALCFNVNLLTALTMPCALCRFPSLQRILLAAPCCRLHPCLGMDFRRLLLPPDATEYLRLRNVTARSY